MMLQTGKSDSILGILKDMEDNETCNHLTFTKIVKLTRNIGTSKVISRLFYLFNTLSNRGSLMAVQWNTKAQFSTWRDLKMGIKLMKNILPVSKLDHCEIYSINIKYTLTIQKINWVF